MRVKFPVVTLSILFLAASAFAHSNWVGYSGAPGSRGLCASSCHGNPSPTYEVSGFPQSYLPGDTYEISVVGLEGFLKSNFNSSCRLQGSSANGGTILAGVNTETYNVVEETNGVHFISTSSYTGTFFWTAPDAGTGTVTLYFAGMQGDNSNGQNTELTFDSEELSAVSISCENPSPWFCRGQSFYFKLTVTNNTGGDVSGTLDFSGYAGYDCDPASVLVTIPKAKTFGPGVTETYYYFGVPNTAGPGQYSASDGGTLSGYEVFCCMNTDVVQCSPWRMGDNTEWELVEVDRSEVALPITTALAQNYPNPFNATTNISYALADDGKVELKVYNLSGQLVETLADGFQEAGQYVVTWNATEVSSGVYFYKLSTSDYTSIKRMSVLR